MKLKATNIIALLGFVMLAIVFAAVMFVVILFSFPKTSLFGMVAVNERDTQIVYRDQALAEAFDNTRGYCNFIIESNNCNVEVVMPTAGSIAEGTIVVNESATGVAFNSLSRTLISWTETLVNDEVYFKIKVLEPSGVVINNHPTTVYLNLKNTDLPYNFILRNHNSKVNFDFGDKNVTNPDKLHIGGLKIESAAEVTVANSNNIDINQVEVTSNRTKLTCGALVKDKVTITGSGGTQLFETIQGDVTVKGGDNNKFKAERTKNIVYENLHGSLDVNYCGALNVVTSTANVAVTEADGKVTMATDAGNLNMEKILSGGLDFTACTTASVSVNTALAGDVKVTNHGIGEISLNKISDASIVDITSSEKNGGEIFVDFDYQAGDADCELKIESYDGNIKANKVHGHTDITIKNPIAVGFGGAGGYANVDITFSKVTDDDNKIQMGAYANSQDGIGNVVVRLSHTNPFQLTLVGAMTPWSYLNDEINGEKWEPNTTYDVPSYGLSTLGKLYVSTPAGFEIRKATTI